MNSRQWCWRPDAHPAGPQCGESAFQPQALHVNILLQYPDSDEPQWPSVGSNGLVRWEDPKRRPSFRKYTVRSLDLAAGTLAIDFLLRGDAGLATRAKAGGTTQLLADAVRRAPFPQDGSTVYAWAGCEFDDFRSIRSFLRRERGLKTREHLVVSYWRRGAAEDTGSD